MFKSIKDYLFMILIWLDQGVNGLTFGSYDHTISGRAGYYAARGHKGYIVLQKVINTIFFDKDHCWNAIEFDIMYRSHPDDVINLKERKITPKV